MRGPNGPPSPRDWDREDWRGAAVLVLATGLVLVLLVLALGAALGSYEPKAAATGGVGVIGAIVGSLATYIGGRRHE